MDFTPLLQNEFVKLSGAGIVGAVLYRLLTVMLNGRGFVNEHTTLRAEIRAELDSVRQEVISLRTEVDTWRERYYAQVEKTAELQVEINILRMELNEYKEKFSKLPIINTDDNNVS